MAAMGSRRLGNPSVRDRRVKEDEIVGNLQSITDSLYRETPNINSL